MRSTSRPIRRREKASKRPAQQNPRRFTHVHKSRLRIDFPFAAVLATTCPPDSKALAQDGSGPAFLVILVRHADKAPSPPDDPELTPAGLERARILATALRDARVTAIITTQYRRTRETAEPLADQRRVTPEIVSVGSSVELGAHVAAVVKAVQRHPGETVVVVGHNNTIPLIIAALGGPTVSNICESSYGRLFVIISMMGSGRTVEARYGAADPAPGPDCQ